MRIIGVDKDGNDLEPPDELLDAFTKPSSLFAVSEQATSVGYLRTENAPLLVVAKPILTSQATGPVRGTMVFAKYLTDSSSEIFSNTRDANNIESTYTYVDARDKPTDIPATSLLSRETPFVQILSSQKIGGYQIVNDIYGQPLFIVRTVQERVIYQESIQALTYYLLISMIIVVLTTAVAFFVTRELAKRDQVIQLKNDFFSIASHELRTPLTAIKGNSKLIKDNMDKLTSDDLRTMMDDIYTSSDRLIHLVTNFLDLGFTERIKNNPVK